MKKQLPLLNVTDINQEIIECISEKLGKFSFGNNSIKTIPAYTTKIINADGKKSDVLITVTASKDKLGMLRYVTMSAMRVDGVL